MDTNELCSVCGEGHVSVRVDQVESEYKGRRAMVPLHYKVCSTCSSDFAGAEESRLNKRAILAFRKSVDGLLTGGEILALRKQYRLTQDQAAKLFGGGPVAFSKYENDDVAHSESMDSLLRLVRRCQLALWELADEKGMAAELVHVIAVSETDSKAAATIGVHTTNVRLMSDYRDASFRASANRVFTYSTEPRKWK